MVVAVPADSTPSAAPSQAATLAPAPLNTSLPERLSKETTEDRSTGSRDELTDARNSDTRQGKGSPAPVSDPKNPQPIAAATARSQAQSKTEYPIQWFVADDDGTYKKLETSAIRAGIERAEIDADTLLWHKGWPEWRTAGEAPEWRLLVEAVAARLQEARDKTESDRQLSEHPISVEDEAPLNPKFSSNPKEERASETTAYKEDDEEDDEENEAQNSRLEARDSVPQDKSATPSATVVVQIITDEDEAEDPPLDRAEAENAPQEPQQTREQDTAAGADPNDDQKIVASGLGRRPTDQHAISLPIVRIQPGEDRRSPPRSPQLHTHHRDAMAAPLSSSGHVLPSNPQEGRFSPRHPPQGTPIDSGGRASEEDGVDSAWAPATDTYIGRRNNFTHRLGSQEQRAELIAQVDREQRLRQQVRSWQWIALACATAAIVAFSMTVYAMINLSIARSDVQALRSSIDLLQLERDNESAELD